MISNKEIAVYFQDLGNLMELHKDNPFKIRSYKNAYLTIRKLGAPLAEMPREEIEAIKGVGKNIANKIEEIIATGKMATLDKFKDKTPPGVQEMLHLKGFGPKKIFTVWKDLGTESIGELLYACNENRLIELKGFGEKTQNELIKTLEYFIQSKDKMHYAQAQAKMDDVKSYLQKKDATLLLNEISDLNRKEIIVESNDLLIGTEQRIENILDEKFEMLSSNNDVYTCKFESYQFNVLLCSPNEFQKTVFHKTGPQIFVDQFDLSETFQNQEDIFKTNNKDFIPEECRHIEDILNKGEAIAKLVSDADIKGVIHNHSTYSDGINSLEEMAKACIDMHYEYLVISDHSKSAIYANGLSPDRVLEQFQEIDRLNEQLAPFKIFKCIESDILANGNLDYEEEILKQFDLIIASVHTGLK
ncbi:MAG: helix-hairpin-helix domain-containing protein, partial [Bacteroidota bacterium]